MKLLVLVLEEGMNQLLSHAFMILQTSDIYLKSFPDFEECKLMLFLLLEVIL